MKAIIILVIVLVVLIAIVLLVSPEGYVRRKSQFMMGSSTESYTGPGAPPPASPPVSRPAKVIYGTSQDDASVQAARADCGRRGGTFNTCGSPCTPGAEVCAQVCALTCEF